MKTRIIGIWVLLLCAGTAGAAQPPCWGILTGNTVRVRSGPDVLYREMCALDRDRAVRVLSASPDGKWLRIVPPEEGEVWVFAKYVRVEGKQGVVTGDKVRVRVRPSLKGEVVDRLDKGALLTVKGRGQGDLGEWLKVAPPPGSRAWVNAQYVRRITDEQYAAHRKAKIEVARLEAERKKREAERLAKLRREAERKKREAKLMAEADRVFDAELARRFESRLLDKPRRAYREAQGRIREPGLLRKITVKLLVLEEMLSVQSAIKKKAAPRPLAKFDFARAKTAFAMQREIDDLFAAHRRAREIARKAQQQIVRRPDLRRTADGWVFYLGAGLSGSGATHRIIRDGRLRALVKADRLHLDAFVGRRVRVVGKLSGAVRLSPGAKPTEVIDIARLEMACH